MKNLLPLPEVEQGISRLKEKAKLKKGTENEIRILVYCLSFIEHQYGDIIVGKPYRQRNDGSVLCVDNWAVDVQLSAVCHELGFIYICLTESIDDYDIRRIMIMII
jgi:hypothetical protein